MLMRIGQARTQRELRRARNHRKGSRQTPQLLKEPRSSCSCRTMQTMPRNRRSHNKGSCQAHPQEPHRSRSSPRSRSSSNKGSRQVHPLSQEPRRSRSSPRSASSNKGSRQVHPLSQEPHRSRSSPRSHSNKGSRQVHALSQEPHRSRSSPRSSSSSSSSRNKGSRQVHLISQEPPNRTFWLRIWVQRGSFERCFNQDHIVFDPFKPFLGRC